MPGGYEIRGLEHVASWAATGPDPERVAIVKTWLRAAAIAPGQVTSDVYKRVGAEHRTLRVAAIPFASALVIFAATTDPSRVLTIFCVIAL